MYWVYITEESEAGMTIGFSAEMDKMLLILSTCGKRLLSLAKNNQEIYTSSSGRDKAISRQTFS